THFRGRHTKSSFRSILDTIDGLGPQTKTKLLRTFGSPDAIQNAPMKELEAAIGKRKTALLQKSFQRSNNEL
ncbi:MAG TPA: helix-hairpin-helix domain-containing protein, partial [Patescibacteria group bacterium]|nr:helix-hairpin-helix domain-containing protein [Patescibacteria group bacterium]